MVKKITIVQHSRDAGAGMLAPLLAQMGVGLNCVWRDNYTPAVLRELVVHAPALIVLGGGDSCHSTAGWRDALVDGLAERESANVPTLGICLGHQLLALAAGGAVSAHPAGHRIGVYPVVRARGAPAWWPTFESVVHWNSDAVMSVPARVTTCASDEHGSIVAAAYASRVLGITAHPEATLHTLSTWAADRGDVARLGRVGIQPAERVRSAVSQAGALSRTSATFVQQIAYPLLVAGASFA